MAQAATNKIKADPAKESTMGSHGSFYWNELMTHDVPRAQKFYADTIGWTFEPMPMDWGTYWIITAGEKMAGDRSPAVQVLLPVGRAD